MSDTNLPAIMVDLARKQLLAEAARTDDTRPSSREDAARHEAGRAIGAALMGGSVGSCSLRQTGDGWAGKTAMIEPTTWRACLPSGERILTPAGAVAHAFFTLAAPLAKRQRGGGAGAANLARDIGPMMRVHELLRSAAVVAAHPEAPPLNEEAIEPLQTAIIDIAFRFQGIVMGAVAQHVARVDDFAKALMTREHLAPHEVAPLLRGVATVPPKDVFDFLRQGLPFGPLPPDLPPAYLDVTHARALGLDLG